MVTLNAYAGGFKVGKIHLIIEGERAKLADIYIFNTKRMVPSWIPIFTIRMNFRNKGYGSALLQAAISYCKEVGVGAIYGEAVGELQKLLPWYERHGFSVTDKNNIFLKINV